MCAVRTDLRFYKTRKHEIGSLDAFSYLHAQVQYLMHVKMVLMEIKLRP